MAKKTKIEKIAEGVEALAPGVTARVEALGTTLGKRWDALVTEYGKPAIVHILDLLPGATPTQVRRTANTLIDRGHPEVRASAREASAARGGGCRLPKADPPPRRSGQSKAQAAEEVVVRNTVPVQVASTGTRVQPSLTVEGVHPALAERGDNNTGLGGEFVEDLPNLSVDVGNNRLGEINPVRLEDHEGEYVLISMSDRAAAGDDILRINDQDLRVPIERLGGQDFIHDPHSPEAIWANDAAGVTKHMDLAQQARLLNGKDPLFMPFTMSHQGIDFSHLPRTGMLAYEDATRSTASKEALDRQIREILGSEYRSMEDPASLAVFMAADTPAKRKALTTLLHGQWATGGLGLGPARAAMTDLGQMGTHMLDLRNVGRIDARASPAPSNHPSFPVGIPGEPVGRLEHPVAALSLLPNEMEEWRLTDPRGFKTGVNKGEPSVPWSLQLKPRLAQITDTLLRGRDDRGYADGGPVSLAVRV